MGSWTCPRPPSHRGSGAPGQSCRGSHPATTDPSQTPQETQSRTGPVRPPGPQPSHALPAARGQQGCRLTGSRLGGHHHGLEASQHSGPVSESGPGKTTPERDRPALHAPTAEPPGLPWVGTFLQATPSTEAPRHGPSQVLTGLCPSSGDSAMPGSRGTPAHSRTPRSLSPPWVRAGWTLHSQVCPPPCAPITPEPVSRRVWSPPHGGAQGSTHRAPLLGEGREPGPNGQCWSPVGRQPEDSQAPGRLFPVRQPTPTWLPGMQEADELQASSGVRPQSPSCPRFLPCPTRDTRRPGRLSDSSNIGLGLPWADCPVFLRSSLLHLFVIPGCLSGAWGVAAGRHRPRCSLRTGAAQGHERRRRDGLECGSPCLICSGVSQGDFLGEAALLATVGEKEYLGLGDRTEGCTRTRQSSACTDGPWGGRGNSAGSARGSQLQDPTLSQKESPAGQGLLRPEQARAPDPGRWEGPEGGLGPQGGRLSFPTPAPGP